MKKTLMHLALTGMSLVSAWVPAQAQTDDGALLRCRQLATEAARLSCYDTLADQARQRLAARPAGTTAPSAAAASADKVAEFGQPPKPGAGDIEVMESRIVGRFEGWRPGQRFTLANGQVWQIVDDSSGFGDSQEPVVRIRRAALGSFMMEVDGVTRSPRVKRLR
jgi:hypothetical protein